MASSLGSSRTAMQGAGQSIENPFRNNGGVGVLLSHAKDFGLSEAQIDQLEAMRPNFEIERHDLQAALLKAETRLRAVVQDETATENEAMTAIDEVTRCQGELLKMRYHHLQKARGVLNNDQRSKVRAFRRQQDQDKADQHRQ